MSLLYTNNKDDDIVNMIAAEVSHESDFGRLAAKRSSKIARVTLQPDPLFALLNQVHVGTQNCNSQMESYIYDRTREGVFYLDLSKTWEKTMVAARIIAAVQEKNKKDVLVSSLFFCFVVATASDTMFRVSLPPCLVAFSNCCFSQVVSSREYAQRAILKFATNTGANYMGGKWVSGTFTNQNTKK